VDDEIARLRARIADQERELERLRADLDAFASSASHDLMEPLRMVASYLALLSRRYKGKLDAEGDEFIEFAVDGARRMQKLIQDLVAYMRVGSRGGALVPTDANGVLGTVVEALRGRLDAASGAVEARPLPVVLADPAQLARVFQCLLDNALTYRSDAAPRIAILAEPRDGEWQFTVRDNGVGFEMAHAERVFGLFHRLHGLSEHPGSGMGLAIARRIVDRHGGRIWAEAEPSRGATFRFTLRAA
jgi:light-regulated signal transduction histidine kinase (bacteriophytochrome)